MGLRSTARCAAPKTTLLVLALQPTRRGAWCRSDRKKSYKLGDLSLLVGRLSAAGDAIEAIVGGDLRGADRGERTFTALLEKPGRYVLLPFCLGSGPSAAESVKAAPLARLSSSDVACHQPSGGAPHLKRDPHLNIPHS